MTIRLLSPQLTNQIAAGEVVERPASVIKELIENSIDAGATQIDIEIEQGGIKRIQIRDNGSGIPKNELALALARHATSKIANLNDLMAIRSLGFRGEALASISSVSRLTLTSRIAEQTEAWQVYVEGQDMEATIKPAAHPVGSTLDVVDLFYNTPGRRRFLKSEKTEFSHIDAMLKKTALAYPLITFQVHHNGKRTHHYRSATDEKQLTRRLVAICGEGFVSNAVKLDWAHDDYHIRGWVNPKSDKETQYFYVNQRSVRDRLLSHAIKHAFEPLQSEFKPAYVIYLTLKPEDVDVNVHPAKHEVRFQESRLVHDFVYQAVTMAIDRHFTDQSSTPTAVENRVAAGVNIFTNPSVVGSSLPSKPAAAHRERPSKKILSHYRDLVTPSAPLIEATSTPLFPKRTTPLTATQDTATLPKFGKVISLWADSYAILHTNDGLQLVSLDKAEQILYSSRLHEQTTQAAEKLLSPLRCKVAEKEIQSWQCHIEVFAAINVIFQIHDNTVQLQAVPALLRTMNWQYLITELTAYLNHLPIKNFTIDRVIEWFATQYCRWIHANHRKGAWSQIQVVSLLTQLEQTQLNVTTYDHFLQPIDMTGPMALLQSR